MSEIYENAIDSLAIGMGHFLSEPTYSTRKHAIVTLFHAIELLLKEQLYRVNPVLIYRSIDARITDDSVTVGIKEALARLENLGMELPKSMREPMERLQKRRNRIEHHRYDHRAEDESVIGDALKLIVFYVEDVLEERLADKIDGPTVERIKSLVFQRNERRAIADGRMQAWAKTVWPDWRPEAADIPDEFTGTCDCPVCRESFLIFGYHERPYCFYCGSEVEAVLCDSCGRPCLADRPCCKANFLERATD